MKIRYTRPDGMLADFELTDQPATIGRNVEADIVVADERVSRIHCGIRMWDGEYFLKDLKSKNGTFVNGQRVDVHKLVPGDVIRLGSATLTVDQEAGMGANTALHEIGGKMDDGKGYSTILKEIVHGEESPTPAGAGENAKEKAGAEDAAPSSADEAAGGPKTRRKVRIVLKKRPAAPGA